MITKLKKPADRTHKSFLEAMPGLCGDIARYVYSRLEFDQPALAMGTAISFVGALKSNRYKNRFNIPTNIYVAGIANSGTGKSQCQKAIQQLSLKANCRELLMGKPASDSGLIAALELNPRQYLIWDEFGIALSAISKSRASHDAKIPAVIMDLYSASDSLYIGSQYSNKTQKTTRVDIEKPCLSIFGVSTPVRFYGSLNENFVHDGFLSRWLIFPGEEILRGKTPETYDMPLGIIRKVERENKGLAAYEHGGDVPKTHTTLIEFEDEDYIDAFREVCKQRVVNAQNDIERVFLTRCFEQAIKLASIMCDGYICTAEDLSYVIPLVEYLVESAAKACLEKLFSNENQKSESDMQKRILDLFGIGTTLTKHEIGRAIRKDTKLRNQTLAELSDVGILFEAKPDHKDISVRPTTTYTRMQ